MVLLALVAACAGCSGMSSAVDDADLETGSISARPVSEMRNLPEPPQGVAVADWRMATQALDEALDSSEDDVSIAWQNMETGARGTATPIGAERSGKCRDFMIAILVEQMPDRWVRGEVCRKAGQVEFSQVRVLDQV